jgi:hypothetical protein
MLDSKTIDDSLFKLAKSGRAVKLLYGKEPVQICTSTLYSPFGVKPNIKEWSNFTEYNLDCSLNQSNSENSKTFKETIEHLDEIIQQLVKDNLNLFNVNDENFVYNNILRENKNYPKLIKFNLPRDRNGNFESFMFDIKKDKVPINENNIEDILCKGKIFRCIIECVKIWFYNGKVGSIWKVVQLKFSEKESEDNKTTDNNINSNIYTQLMIDDD